MVGSPICHWRRGQSAQTAMQVSCKRRDRTGQEQESTETKTEILGDNDGQVFHSLLGSLPASIEWVGRLGCFLVH